MSAQPGLQLQGPWVPGSEALCVVWGARPPPSPSHHFLAPPEAAAPNPTAVPGGGPALLSTTCPRPAPARPAHLEGVEEVPEGPGVDDVVIHGQEEGDDHAGDTCAEAEAAEDALRGVPQDTPAVTALSWRHLLQQVYDRVNEDQDAERTFQGSVSRPIFWDWRLMTFS